MAIKKNRLSKRAIIAIALLASGIVLFFVPYMKYVSLLCFIIGFLMAINEMREQAAQQIDNAAGSQRLSWRTKVAITLLAGSIVWFIVYLVNQYLWWTVILFYTCLVIGLILVLIELRGKRRKEQIQPTRLSKTTTGTKQATETSTAPDYIDLSVSYRPATITLLNERYEIIKKIAEGGMATINLAKDHQRKTQCVIKTPRPATQHDPRINIEKLTVEAEYLKRFQHPHIVKFIDLFRCDHTPHLVVEYIEGANLLETCAKTPAEEGVALLWAGQILDAIAYLHRQGLIHRDLNPGNIMVRPDNTAVIIDFGTVKDISARSNPDSKDFTIIAKSGFSIPELLTTGHADERADLCGLGKTLFYLLTSTRPELQGSNVDIVDLLMARKISARTAKCIAQAMNVDPALRFKDASAMGKALGV